MESIRLHMIKPKQHQVTMTTPIPSVIPLTETFSFSTTTHSYNIRWTSLGNANAPPLIFIHGTPWSSRVWHTYALSFAKYFHVYLFDNPGFGESPLGQPLPDKAETLTKEIALDADLAQQSEAFAALYKSWEEGWPQAQRKPHVVAHDHGGLMALRANLLHGCEYASLCLIDVVALGPFGQPLFKLVAENAGVFEALTGPVFEGVVESYIRDAAYKELSRETMEMLKWPWLVSEEGRRGFVRQMVQANSRSTEEVEGRYHEVGRKMPVRVIWGKEDKWIPVETAQRLKDKLEGQDVVVIEEGGHLLMYDQEGRLGVELGWWLNSVSHR
ncbi:alpha/beta hydrolase [Aspergillus steynii IBT 23096]|uniref:Alpha/beta hydrolase n=1 Tax=Aspergillus steynii IBT 23096 TaxID=1392250 RepID=A0A2I2GAX2_9EURO|nr:alpha/beta hydrolase [Aspergillus steynii IBT 23096]PLB50032.1 alpha/beta hydrolase [Aspergillus steynii IBT 23096]